MKHLAEKTGNEQAANIVSLLGFEAVDLYNSLPLEHEVENSIVEKTLSYIEEHFMGKQNTINEWFIFSPGSRIKVVFVCKELPQAPASDESM